MVPVRSVGMKLLLWEYLLQREGGHQMVEEAQTPECLSSFFCGAYQVSSFVCLALRQSGFV